jgi:hypothetical protein
MSAQLSRIRSARFPENFHFEYIIVNQTRENRSDEHLWCPPDEFRAMIMANPKKNFHRDSDLAAKFIFALRFFLQNSKADWCWRALEDTILNFGNLPRFVAYLDERYDPLKDVVVLGNCIDRDQVHDGRLYPGFLQGGAGWVVSRRAAELIEPMAWTWVPNINWADDVAFTEVLQRLNLSVFDATSEFFLGHDIKDGDRNWIRNPDGLKVCPGADGRKAIRCRRFTAPLKDLVVWHRQWQRSEALADDAQITFDAHPDVHFWMDASDTALCRVKSPLA